MEQQTNPEKTSVISKNNATPSGTLATGFEWMSSLITSLLIVAVVFMLFFRVVTVSGHSMDDTLQDTEHLVLISRFYTIERGKIVVINRQEEEPLIKRVIAVAGDTIDINEKTGRIILNGTELTEDYVKGGITPPFSFDGPQTVPDGYIFAMGDNRADSLDSRQLGAFSIHEVIGVTAYRLWPFEAVGQ